MGLQVVNLMILKVNNKREYSHSYIYCQPNPRGLRLVVLIIKFPFWIIYQLERKKSYKTLKYVKNSSPSSVVALKWKLSRNYLFYWYQSVTKIHTHMQFYIWWQQVLSFLPHVYFFVSEIIFPQELLWLSTCYMIYIE